MLDLLTLGTVCLLVTTDRTSCISADINRKRTAPCLWLLNRQN